MTVSQKRFLAVLGVVLCALWVWFGGVHVAEKWGAESISPTSWQTCSLFLQLFLSG